MDNFFDNRRILNLIWKRKFHFVIVGIIAIVLSAVFSGPAFITPRFKSTARLYPTNIWTLSEESETEQLLEILNSNDIKFKMFETFDLDKVYKINREDPQYLTYMFDLYNTYVSTSKTEFETAEIKVLDVDPQRASDMCDSIIYFFNKKVRELHKEKDMEMVVIADRELDKRYNDLAIFAQQLDSLREASGVISFESQVPELTRGYMNALANGRGNSADTKKIEKIYNSFAANGTKLFATESNYNRTVHVIDSLTLVKQKYTAEFEKDITYSHVVEYPFPADKKSYPVRWLIVSFSLFSALFLALLVFLVLDYRKEE